MSNVFDMIASGKVTRLQMQKAMDKDSSNYTKELIKLDTIPESNPRPFAVYRSREFLVQCFKEKNVIRLSINRTVIDKGGTQWADGIKWDDIQDIKNHLGYADKCAVELYPPESCVVNVANMRHIFILEKEPEFMWKNKGGREL